MIQRLTFILLLAGVLTASTGVAQERPNIVIILADDLGYGDLSSYGAEDLQTPNIDALIASGMRFNHFYTNSSVCSPTRAALLTGRYPDLVGVPGVVRAHRKSRTWGYLSPDARLLSDVLRDHGYHTGMVGKWHLGMEPPNVPPKRGFYFYKGFLSGMMDSYYEHSRRGINYMRHGTEPIDPEGHATDLFSTWAINYIQQRTDSEAPFFLYLAYNAPHAPIQPPKEWLQRVKEREPGISDKRAKLVALIEHLDAGIGRVVDALKATGAYDNTLIVFTSDNGGKLRFGASNGPLRGGKGDMYEGGLRVPMGAVWPGHIEPGARTSEVALTMDLFPTVLDAAGIDVMHEIDGRSFLPLLSGQDTTFATERTVFFVRREGRRRFMGQAVYAVRRGPWKLLQNCATCAFELYNLANDPYEQNNLAEEKPRIFRELARALRSHMHEAGQVPWQKQYDQ